jgi:hypothetical protein
MSPLWKLTRSPNRYLIILVLLVGCVLLDSTRHPSDQVSVKLLVASIRIYQRAGGSLMASLGIHCRYQPSCSNYCIQALQRYGVAKGLLLCVRRVFSCTKEVPPGTIDPVPQ